jgi:hypothetical protein
MAGHVQALLLAGLAATMLWATIQPARAFDQNGQNGPGRAGPPRAEGTAPLVAPMLPRLPEGAAPRGQSWARDAVRRGDIRSLEDVMTVVQRRYPGQLLDVRFDQGGGRYVYNLKMLTHRGRVLLVAVDARTAKILGVTGNRR